MHLPIVLLSLVVTASVHPTHVLALESPGIDCILINRYPNGYPREWVCPDAPKEAPKAEKMQSASRVAAIVVFPVVHPVKTVKGFFFGLLHGVGTVVDTVEYVTGKIAAGVAKVDGAVDTLEDASNPAQKGVASGKQHSHTAAPRSN